MYTNSKFIMFDKEYNGFFSTNREHISLITIWGCRCNDEIFHIKTIYIFRLPLEKTLNIIKMYSLDNLSCNICNQSFITFDYLSKDQINEWIKGLPITKNRLIVYDEEDIKKIITNFQFNSIDFVNG